MKKKDKKFRVGTSCYIKVYIKKPFILRRLLNRVLGLNDKNKYIFTKVPPHKAKI
jgi:hypothetical protein